MAGCRVEPLGVGAIIADRSGRAAGLRDPRIHPRFGHPPQSRVQRGFLRLCRPFRAAGETKRLLTGSADRALADLLQVQVGGFARCAATLDLAEGVRAIRERRKPSLADR